MFYVIIKEFLRTFTRMWKDYYVRYKGEIMKKLSFLYLEICSTLILSTLKIGYLVVDRGFCDFLKFF